MNDPNRRDVLLFLNSKKGQKYIKDETCTQRQLLTDLEKVTTGTLKKTVEVILSYELFARSLNDVFYDALVELSENSLGLTPNEISKRVEFKNKSFSKQLQQHYEEASEAIKSHPDINLHSRFDTFKNFALTFSSSDCINAVLTHHLAVQQNKSTGAKNPWVFEIQGRWMVRASYAHRDQATHDDSLVNLYRLGVLRLFFEDLGEINA